MRSGSSLSLRVRRRGKHAVILSFEAGAEVAPSISSIAPRGCAHESAALPDEILLGSLDCAKPFLRHRIFGPRRAARSCHERAARESSQTSRLRAPGTVVRCDRRDKFWVRQHPARRLWRLQLRGERMGWRTWAWAAVGFGVVGSML